MLAGSDFTAVRFPNHAATMASFLKSDVTAAASAMPAAADARSTVSSAAGQSANARAHAETDADAIADARTYDVADADAANATRPANKHAAIAADG